VTPEEQARSARLAGLRLATTPAAFRDAVLAAYADSIEASADRILAENAEDVRVAGDTGLAAPLLKRLELTPAKVAQMVSGMRELASLPDPLGKVIRRTELDAGLVLEQVSVPIGLVGIIFESRPDALVQISGLCIKSGNAAILKGGAEAARTNTALHGLIVEAIRAEEPALCDAVQLVAGREEIRALLKLDEVIDLMIPRGSGELVRTIKDNTRIPVLGHTEGVCHLYVDEAADLEMAVELVFDSKCQYPAVCNAVETLLVHGAVADRVLAAVARRLAGVELRADERALARLPGARPADEQDWRAEYNDLILAVKVVDDLEEAIRHINAYGSHHTDAIVTGDKERAERFMAGVDSASVMWNCSTRFADGFRYGFGAEVGISTNKIHARGPVGLEGLTIYKFRILGSGQAVADYVEGRRGFTHRELDRS
jgi:glutamate-5-semialdehyde dehydrogenase